MRRRESATADVALSSTSPGAFDSILAPSRAADRKAAM
jgi:hypothetical protein